MAAEQPKLWVTSGTYIGLGDYISEEPVWEDAYRPSEDTTTKGPWKAYLGVLKLLRSQGWILTDQPGMRQHYKALLTTNHAAAKGKLRMESSLNCGQSHFEFYEDVVRDNKFGGRYHSDKLDKMPYLDRLRLKLIIGKIVRYLVDEHGYYDATDPKIPVGGPELVYYMWRRWSFHRYDWRAEEISKAPNYGSKTADGQKVDNFDWVYYRDYKGHIGRGRAFWDGNNMMVVIPNNKSWWRDSANSLSKTWNGVRKQYSDGRQQEANALTRAIQNREYLRAAQIQAHMDLKYRIVPPPKPGDIVQIESSRYHGKAPVVEVDALGVSCRLNSGNVRWYEYGTVSVVSP